MIKFLISGIVLGLVFGAFFSMYLNGYGLKLSLILFIPMSVLIIVGLLWVSAEFELKRIKEKGIKYFTIALFTYTYRVISFVLIFPTIFNQIAYLSYSEIKEYSPKAKTRKKLKRFEKILYDTPAIQKAFGY